MYTLVQYIYASKLTFMTFLFGIKIHLADFMHRCSASFYAMASLLQTLVYNLALYNSYVKCETYVHGQKNHANIVLSAYQEARLYVYCWEYNLSSAFHIHFI